MTRFLFTYNGGAMPESEEALEQSKAAWGAWLGALGASAVDPGNPVVATKAVSPDGRVAEAHDAVGGYSLIEAGSLDEAVELAKGCPVLAGGGTVDVGELAPFM
jgi:hypothetical protein